MSSFLVLRYFRKFPESLARLFFSPVSNFTSQNLQWIKGLIYHRSKRSVIKRLFQKLASKFYQICVIKISCCYKYPVVITGVYTLHFFTLQALSNPTFTRPAFTNPTFTLSDFTLPDLQSGIYRFRVWCSPMAAVSVLRIKEWRVPPTLRKNMC